MRNRLLIQVGLIGLALLQGALGGMALRQAYGFDAGEHKRVSDDAYRLAFKAVSSAQGRAAKDPAVRSLLNNGGFSYGDVVEAVDALSSPTDLISFDPGTGTEMLDREKLAQSVAKVNSRWSTLKKLEAAHSNAKHFADKTLTSYQYDHFAAIQLFKANKTLTALISNAFADHYMEDFYASGHVITQRQKLHDIPAMSQHDKVNWYGLKFRFAHLDTLQAFIDKLPHDAPEYLYYCGELEKMRSHPELTFYGDGKLRSLQESFVVLVTAKSIYEVLAPDGAVPEEMFGSFMYRNPFLARDGEEFARSRYGSFSRPAGYTFYYLPSMIFSLGVNNNSTIDDNLGKVTFSPSLIVYFPETLQPLSDYGIDFGEGVGPNFAIDRGPKYKGVEVSLITFLRPINSLFALSFAPHKEQTVNGARDVVGYYLRYETGYSLVNLNIGIGWDGIVDAKGDLKNDLVFTAGAKFYYYAPIMEMVASLFKSTPN